MVLIILGLPVAVSCFSMLLLMYVVSHQSVSSWVLSIIDYGVGLYGLGCYSH